jgi:uracil-DNA glycosylase
MSSFAKHWEGFLPPGALVMAKKASRKPSAQSAEPRAFPARILLEGNPHADLFFVADHLPFEGAAGELLVKMIEAMGLTREQVCLLNLADATDAAAYSSALRAQLAQTHPKIIVALGAVAAQALQGFGEFRVVPTLHPAELLRDPASKRKAWTDLQLVAKELGISLPKKPTPKA